MDITGSESTNKPVKVFISYSHDSAEHTQLVLQLANTLRRNGVDVELDQYHVRPPQGWPRWCEEQLRPENADFVLTICTDTYRRRIEGKTSADEGRGVFWEGGLIYNYIYNTKENRRFIPVLLTGAKDEDIPMPLQGYTRYHLGTFDLDDAGYKALYCDLTDQRAIVKPPLGEVVSVSQESLTQVSVLPSLPTYETKTILLPHGVQVSPTRLRHGAEKLVGRQKELKRLDRAWAGSKRKKVNVVTIVAWGGVGKTALVMDWMARMAAKYWRGAERVFDWSFYSQGTSETTTASADTFVAKALEFFGDSEMAKSAASPWDKGERLARLVAERKTLLVLDGVEPLQHPPGPVGGKLKDPALEALLKGLAQHNSGLCIVTTREPLTDLDGWMDKTLAYLGEPEQPDDKYPRLSRLSTEAGAQLLFDAGVKRAGNAKIKTDDQELKDAAHEVEGHALTLNLLGRYLAKAHGGDIRRRDQVKFDKADAKVQGGHAFKVMKAYEIWLGKGGEDGARQLAVLKLLGLFDRPVDVGCITALRKEPPIEKLTESLVGLDDEDWNYTISNLRECGFITAHSDELTLDAHPLVREYFGKKLRDGSPDAWREAHRRLYEHLTESTEHRPATLAGLQPLYQAVAHGCLAGMHQEACEKVYRGRILRGSEAYSTKNLGAIGSDLAAVACFFERPWSAVSDQLSEVEQAWIMNEAAFDLRGLGHLTEALEPMRIATQWVFKKKDWPHASIGANNLSEIELILGLVTEAVRDAKRSMDYADRSGYEVWKIYIISRTTLGNALLQAGQKDEAAEQFRQAETMQAEHQSEYPLLYSQGGFKYCDLLLAPGERAAWQCLLKLKTRISELKMATAACRSVEQRAIQTLEWVTEGRLPFLTIAIEHLTLGRAYLHQTILAKSEIRIAKSEIEEAVAGLRNAGQLDHLPHGLLSRALLLFAEDDIDGCRADLDEAWQIAERGSMRLHMADVLLHRGRLFRDKTALAEAARLIEQCGYHRRDGELADAEEAAKGW